MRLIPQRSLFRGFIVFILFWVCPVMAYSQTLYYTFLDETESPQTLSDNYKEILQHFVQLEIPPFLELMAFKELPFSEEKKEELLELLQSRKQQEEKDQDSEEDPQTQSAASNAPSEESINNDATSPEANQSQESTSQNEETTQSTESTSLETSTQTTETNEDSSSESLEDLKNSTEVDPIFSLLQVQEATATDGFVFLHLKKGESKELSENQFFQELEFDFYITSENRKTVYYSPLRVLALGKTIEETESELIRSLHVSFKSVLNSLLRRTGSPFIVDFINNKKVVIAHGKKQGAFPGAFYQILRHQFNEAGKMEERVIGRLYVEKCEEEYSFCRILFSKEAPVPGDRVQKVKGVGIHQSFGYDFVISTVAEADNSVSYFFNHMIGTRFVVNREMPIAKPMVGFELLTGSAKQLNQVGMMKVPLVANFFVGMQVDRFFHQFSLSPFLDVGIAFTGNAMSGKKALTWFTCKAGGRFQWFFHERVGLYLEGGYIAWLGIPGKESVFEDETYVYYAPTDYTGGFCGIGFTFLY